MPEYLSPGVYVEEVSFRSKSIEGVATSTTGFAGMTRYGPVPYAWSDDGGATIRNGPAGSEPRLVTSFTEFERVYGGLDPLELDDGTRRIPYLAHAARAFFLNGGRRLYVSRVYGPSTDPLGDPDVQISSAPVPAGVGPAGAFRGRWPGRRGDARITVRLVRGRDVAVESGGTVRAAGVRTGAVLEVLAAGAAPPPPLADGTPVVNLADVAVLSAVDPDGTQHFDGAGGAPAAGGSVRELTLQITIQVDDDLPTVVDALATHPAQPRDIVRIMQLDDPEDPDAVVWFDHPARPDHPDIAALLLVDLVAGSPYQLTGGRDGTLMSSSGEHGLEGRAADPDRVDRPATGLEALAEIDDVAIVAAPDMGTLASADDAKVAGDMLIAHAERPGAYRIAVLDGPQDQQSLNEIRAFRGKFDSSRAAIYHPWVRILNPQQRPTQGAPPESLVLPPSGFVTGIYARNDITRGVHKAPANEVVRGLTRFEVNINTARNDVLNPEGINALRFFEGRGSRVWGARTISSDPEWKYVNVRRFFNYLEHSIDKATQWAVFEPNNERLWRNIRQMIEDFLLVEWQKGALLGSKPEEAYFVRCDRTTMTQNDIDNGRLICLVGVSPTKPAEFVIFRIGQWTAEAGLV
ncbi:MAG: phage tail sheath family protein [Acidimicrobiales bacterium]